MQHSSSALSSNSVTCMQQPALHLHAAHNVAPVSLAYVTQVQELLQQVSSLSNRTVMVDTCKALLAQQPADAVAAHLQKALNLSGQASWHSGWCQVAKVGAAAVLACPACRLAPVSLCH
jgi:hypothetical protein